MAKMATRSSPAKDPEKDSPPRSQNILQNPSSELCKFTDPEIDQIRHCFPEGTVFREFDSSMKSDCLSDTWVCFPAAPFQIGFTYPFPIFTQTFFSHTGLCYSQPMPMLWRVLFTLEQIKKEEGISFGLSKLPHLYNLVTHGSHRYLFKAKPHKPLPLLKTTKNDSYWKNQFFFVRRDSIPSGDSIPKKWNLKGRI